MGKLGNNQYTNKKIKFKKSLASRYPQILKFWNYEKNTIKPNEVYPFTDKKVYWVCKRTSKHIWRRRICDEVYSYHRFSKLGPTCPHCGVKNVPKGESLKDKFPLIAKEFHPKKNEPLKAEDFSLNSKKKVWWICKRNNNHEFSNTVGNRVKFLQGCPKCKGRQISKFQIIIYTELKTIFKDVNLTDRSTKYEVDVFSKKYNFAVEVDGFRYHRILEKRDIEKNKYFKRNNISIYRFRDDKLKMISAKDISYKDVKIRHDQSYQKELINALLRKMLKEKKYNNVNKLLNTYLNKKNLQNVKEFLLINDAVPGPIKGNSLSDKSPVVAQEFHTQKNGSLKPDLISNGSDMIVWWQCKKNIDHQWQAAVKARTKKISPTKCPFCSRKYADSKTNIAAVYPNELKYIHPKMNENFDPKKSLDGSQVNLWWICKNNPKHVFKREIRIYLKTNKRRCPICNPKGSGNCIFKILK